MLPRPDVNLARHHGRVSPSRRLLLQCVALVAVVLAVALVAARLTRSDVRPRLAAVPQDRPGPVLLVPGYGGSTTSLQVLAGRLRAAGRDASVVTLPGEGTGDLVAQARVLDAAARAAVAAGAPSVDVVGYSAGGVVVRLWARNLDGDGLARRIVTLGSPHHGTKVAALGAAFAPGACPTACQQLVPGSTLLKGLNAGDETPAGPQWLSLWTAQDQTVTPPESARLAGATDVVLQDVCGGLQLTHSDLPRSPLVAGIVLQALGTQDVRQPRGCSALQAAGR